MDGIVYPPPGNVGVTVGVRVGLGVAVRVAVAVWVGIGDAVGVRLGRSVAVITIGVGEYNQRGGVARGVTVRASGLPAGACGVLVGDAVTVVVGVTRASVRVGVTLGSAVVGVSVMCAINCGVSGPASGPQPGAASISAITAPVRMWA